MVRDGEGEAGDDDVAEGLPGDVHAGPKAVGAEEDAVDVFFEFVQHLVPGHAAPLDEESPAVIEAEVLDAVGQGGHLVVAGEEDEGATFGEAEEVLDLLLHGLGVFGAAGLGHALDQVKLHLLFEVEGAFDGGGLGFEGADAFAEVVELDVIADAEGGAGEDAGFGAGEEDAFELGRDIDGGAVKGDDAVVPAAAFGPIDVAFFALIQEGADGDAECAEAFGDVEDLELLAFAFGGVAGFLGDAGDALQGQGEGVLQESGLAHAEFFAVGAAEMAGVFGGAEEAFHHAEALGDFAGAVLFAEGLEKAFAGLGIEEAA